MLEKILSCLHSTTICQIVVLLLVIIMLGYICADLPIMLVFFVENGLVFWT